MFFMQEQENEGGTEMRLGRYFDRIFLLVLTLRFSENQTKKKKEALKYHFYMDISNGF